MDETVATTGDGLQDPDDRVGQVLSDRYRILARIGAGGMGVVYRAWDEQADGYVVVKSPKGHLGFDAEILGRFRLELSALRKLSHPGIVPIIDVGSTNALPFAVMPYLAGGSLKQRRRFQDDKPLPIQPQDLWHWLPSVAAALDFVHVGGYVHRDVKPDNILFDGRGNPFLGDFGLAKIVLEDAEQSAAQMLSKTGLTVGTPHYMAPEVIMHSQVTAQADQFALAVMVYELLAGRKPFDGLAPSAVLVANASTEPPSLEEHAPHLHRTVVAAITRGLAKDPAARFPGCGALAEAVLERVPRPEPAKRFRLMCPACGKLLTVYPQLAGRPGACPKCGVQLQIGKDLLSLWLREDREGRAAFIYGSDDADFGLTEDSPRGGQEIRWEAAGRAGPLRDLAEFFRELLEVVRDSTVVKVAILLAILAAVATVWFLRTVPDAVPDPLPPPSATPSDPAGAPASPPPAAPTPG